MAGEISQTELEVILKRDFEYDELEGTVTYKVTGMPYSGEIAGVWVKAHRLAWFLKTGKWPELEIDHINGKDYDNRWANLRDVDHSTNMKNQKLHSRNTSGAAGVYWRKDIGRWQAVITANCKKTHLGYFDSFDDAVAARKAAEVEHDFHPNHGEQR